MWINVLHFNANAEKKFREMRQIQDLKIASVKRYCTHYNVLLMGFHESFTNCNERTMFHLR